ncbi:hypothetical protein Tco_0581043 [Tanacetum coccineum]
MGWRARCGGGLVAVRLWSAMVCGVSWCCVWGLLLGMVGELWRVTARSPFTTLSFPIALVTAPPRTRRRVAILIRPEEAIPLGRPYRTRPNGPQMVMTVRTRVGPLPAHRLAWRRVSPRSSDHRLCTSSSYSDSLPRESTTVCSEAFRRWCAAPLSTLYPLTTSESSLGDSSERPLHSFSHSARPSRKRCRSSVDSVPSSTLVRSSLASCPLKEDTEVDPIETEVDMELGIGDEDDVKDHVEIDPRDVRDGTEEYEADTSAGDTVEVGIDPMLAPIVEEEIVEPAGEDSSNSSGTRDGIARSFKDMPIDFDDVVCDFYHHMSEVRIDRIVGIETVQRRLEADQLIARGERGVVNDRRGMRSLRLVNLKGCAMLEIQRDRH